MVASFQAAIADPTLYSFLVDLVRKKPGRGRFTPQFVDRQIALVSEGHQGSLKAIGPAQLKTWALLLKHQGPSTDAASEQPATVRDQPTAAGTQAAAERRKGKKPVEPARALKARSG